MTTIEAILKCIAIFDSPNASNEERRLSEEDFRKASELSDADVLALSLIRR